MNSWTSRGFSTGTLALLLGYILMGTVPARARIRLPALFSNNMVVQSGVPVKIWGSADPNKTVKVAIGDVKATTTSDSYGRWQVQIGPIKSGGPFVMVVKANNNVVVVRNVLVGQVWLCSGQSNMEFPVSPGPGKWETGVDNYEHEIRSAHYPMIRMFTVKQTVAGKPQQGGVAGTWKVTSPVTVGRFSAVAYFFGRDLFNSLHQPVGLINSSWGGTPVSSWMPLQSLQAHPEFQIVLNRWKNERKDIAQEVNNFEQGFKRWRRGLQQAFADGTRLPDPPRMPFGTRSNPYRFRPSGLFNAMIAPLVHYKIRGVIWYQGESDAGQGLLYRKLFPDMIRSWRQVWGWNFPFLFVQLPSFDALPSTDSFPLVREAQLMTLSLPNTAMAVTIDVGDLTSYHPRNKQAVGRRLALAARALVYGQPVEYSGPIYSSMSEAGDKVRIYFKHAHVGLATSGGGDRLEGFQIAGDDHKFYSAKATINGNTVVVWSNHVRHPAAVRYDWKNYPLGNLYSESGLPASPFRTDDWKHWSKARQKR